VHVSVHFRNNTSQPATAVYNIGHHDRGPGYDGGMHIGYVLPLSNHIRYHVRVVFGQFLDVIHGAGTTDVSQGQGPDRRCRRGGQVAGFGPLDHGDVQNRGGVIGCCGRTTHLSRGDGRQRARGRIITILDAVPAAQRVDADGGHSDVLCLPAGQWRVRAAFLLDGRAPGLQGAVGQQHRFTILVRGPADGWPWFRGDAPSRAPDARHDFRWMYGRLTAHSSCLHESVRGRPGPAVRNDTHRRIHNVHVLRSAGHFAHALDTVW